MSGFRDEVTLKVTFDTIYWSVYKSLETRRKSGETVIEIEHFGVVLPIDQICSANLFDEGVYLTYFSDAALGKRPVSALPLHTPTPKTLISD